MASVSKSLARATVNSDLSLVAGFTNQGYFSTLTGPFQRDNPSDDEDSWLLQCPQRGQEDAPQGSVLMTYFDIIMLLNMCVANYRRNQGGKSTFIRCKFSMLRNSNGFLEAFSKAITLIIWIVTALDDMVKVEPLSDGERSLHEVSRSRSTSYRTQAAFSDVHYGRRTQSPGEGRLQSGVWRDNAGLGQCPGTILSSGRWKVKFQLSCQTSKVQKRDSKQGEF
ncbi:predicted protein [Histoplasma capsulatum H143]|uniref:Uncharacterized protein n=1 Tax=Ajellomyces capsulatus (strain H143) TaxID=544712 RepID=C6HTC6_AJECH|nr:predicted protein [Histoplasma capsulatum H143]